MTEERSLRPLSSYLEFGWRLHWEDFSQLTAWALGAYLPLSILTLYIQPPVEMIFKGAEQALPLLPRIFAAQVILRVLETFVLVLIILRIEARRNGDENIWDIEEAFSRIRRVATVDLAYFVGIQAITVLVFWLGLMLASMFIGSGPPSFYFAISVAAFVSIGAAVRYYFASLIALLHGTSFSESFRMAGAVSSGGERLIVTIVMTYMAVRYMMLPYFFSKVFGGDIFGQVMIQAGFIATSIPYYLAGYLLYLDLAPAAKEQVTLSREAIKEVPDDISPDE